MSLEDKINQKHPFMVEFFGEDYTKEEAIRTSEIIRAVAYRFTRLGTEISESGCPFFVPSCSANDMLSFADSLTNDIRRQE